MTEQALQAVRERLPEYVGSVTTKSRAGFWACPLCGSGTGPNKSGAFRIQGERWRCFSCGRGGDVLDLIGEVERIPDFRDRARRAAELFGIDGSVTATAAPVRREPRPEPVFISPETMQASFTAYERNNFALWLVRVFGESKALELALAYRIGTSKHWGGSTVFWQIDDAGRVRAGKVLLYEAATGRRVKEPFNHVTWVHKVLKIEPYNLKQCLFGLHLTALDRSKPVAVVESEKSAIVGAGFVDAFTFVATGGKGTLNKSMLEPLAGRRIVLFPDLGAFNEWSEKAAGWPGVEVSPLLEQRASAEDRERGFDIADLLLREHGINA